MYAVFVTVMSAKLTPAVPSPHLATRATAPKPGSGHIPTGHPVTSRLRQLVKPVPAGTKMLVDITTARVELVTVCYA